MVLEKGMEWSLSLDSDISESLHVQLIEPVLLELWKMPEPEPLPATKEENNLKEPDAASEEKAIFIENAGVVILHPFLPGLFNKLAG